MSGFQHSIVLFTGDDGLPLEFNVRNTTDKVHLKALIEHGGGFCTQNENAVHLISPGTKVLNVDFGKKLVSSSYIYDCVKENFLLEVNEYVFTISEAQTSDMSDEDSDKLRHSTGKSPSKCTTNAMNIAISPIKAVAVKNNETGSTTSSDLTLPPSNASTVPQVSTASSMQSESFVEGTQETSSIFKITSAVYTKDGVAKNNFPKSPILLKSAEKVTEWGLTDFPDANSPSLVSPTISKCTSKEMSLCSPIEFQHFKSSVNISPTVTKSPLKSVITSKSPLKSVITSKSPFVSPEKLVSKSRSVGIKNLSKEFDDVIASLNVNKGLFPTLSIETRSECSSSNLVTPSKTAMMEIDENIIDSKITKSVFSSPDKLPIGIVPIGTASPNNTTVAMSSTSEPIIDKSPTFKNNVSSPKQMEVVLQYPTQSVASSVENNNLSPFKRNAQPSPAHTVVSSSQPEDDLDKFDNMLLSKSQIRPQVEDEDSLSQSYTVSSSADAQPNSADGVAAENIVAPLPDSPSLNANQVIIQNYIKNLETEAQEILKKTSPLSSQEKIILTKYLCCATKLPPATVLGSLFSDSLDL